MTEPLEWIPPFAKGGMDEILVRREHRSKAYLKMYGVEERSGKPKDRHIAWEAAQNE